MSLPPAAPSLPSAPADPHQPSLAVPLASPALPSLPRGHLKRLRELWARGRPSQLSQLEGVHLDLMTSGCLEVLGEDQARGCWGSTVRVTNLGVAVLAQARQALVAAQRPHHELGARLSAWLRAREMLTWENVEFANPDRSAFRAWGVVRPDVFACKPTLRAESSAAAIYEVKVSRADFLADLAKPQKRQAYMELAEAVYFCAPQGLIESSEVPKGIGLLCERAPGEFTIARKASRRKGFVLHPDTAMTLLVKQARALAED